MAYDDGLDEGGWESEKETERRRLNAIEGDLDEAEFESEKASGMRILSEIEDALCGPANAIGKENEMIATVRSTKRRSSSLTRSSAQVELVSEYSGAIFACPQ